MSQKATISIEGMNCQHCVQTVHKALADVAGVTKVEVDLPQKAARVEYDPTAATVGKMMQAVQTSGFTATGFRKN
jgi:copper chaperone